MGLSAVSESILGKPLNSARRTSDWARRPLSDAQLQHAAVSAFAAMQACTVMLENVSSRAEITQLLDM